MVFGSLNTGSIAGVFTGIQVGAAVFISQLLIQDVGLGLLGFWRYAIALLVLLPLLLLDRRPAVASSDWLTVSLLGVGQIGVMITLLNVAVFYTSAGRVAVVFAMLPAVSLIIDKLRGKQIANWLVNLGILLSITGVLVLVGGDALSGSLIIDDIIGMLAALLATCVVALCSSWYQPYVKRYGSVKISAIAFTVSLVPLAVLSLVLPSSTPVMSWAWHIWALMLALGLSSGVGYVLWFHAIKNLPATTVTGFLALSPIATAILSLVFVNSAVTLSILAAVVLVSLGIFCFALSAYPSAKSAPQIELY